MQRAIHRFRQPHIGRYGEEDVRRLHRHLIFVEILVLKQLDMIERAFDQRLGTWLAIFFEQVLFEAARVDADADRAAIGLRSEEHTSELQSLMRISYAVFCLKNKK